MSCFFSGKAKEIILNSPAKTVLLSGPSGFLGSRVFESILHAQMMRADAGLNPGEVILLSGSPGKLMGRLYDKYGADKMKTVRASRVDYYSQHNTETWIDHIGSLGMSLFPLSFLVIFVLIKAVREKMLCSLTLRQLLDLSKESQRL